MYLKDIDKNLFSTGDHKGLFVQVLTYEGALNCHDYIFRSSYPTFLLFRLVNYIAGFPLTDMHKRLQNPFMLLQNSVLSAPGSSKTKVKPNEIYMPYF
jgi:hypothetical protein